MTDKPDMAVPKAERVTEVERRAMDLVSRGRVAEAVNLLKKEAARRRKQGEASAAAWDWFTIGGLLRPDHRRWKDAAKAYERAGLLFHKTNERKGLMLSLLRYAQVMASAGEFDEVVEPARMAMDMAQEDGDREHFIEAMLVVWSGMHALGDEGTADFIELVGKSEIIQENQSIKDQIDLMAKGVEGVDPEFENRLIAANDMATLAHYYNRKGMKSLGEGRHEEAIEYMTNGKYAASKAHDVAAYFLNVMGLIMAYEFKGDKSGAMQALLLGAASIRAVLGDVLDEYFYLIFDGLRAVWGEKDLSRIMSEITRLMDMKTGQK